MAVNCLKVGGVTITIKVKDVYQSIVGKVDVVMLKAVIAIMVLLGLETLVEVTRITEGSFFLELISGVILALAMTYMSVTITMYYQKENFGVDAKLFSGEYLRRFPGFILASTIAGLMIFLGALLLIIPGIVVALGTSLLLQTYYYENLGMIASIKESFSKTRGYKMNMLAVYIPIALAYIVMTSSATYQFITGEQDMRLIAIGLPIRAIIVVVLSLVSVEIYSRIVE